MKLSELKTKLCARELYMPDPEREADGGYCGDFLSFVMQRAPENSVWFTVMTNVNVAAVASLTGVAAVVVCESSAMPSLSKESKKPKLRFLKPTWIFSAR